MNKQRLLVALMLVALMLGLGLIGYTLLTPSAEQSAAVRAASVFAISNTQRASEGMPQLSQNPLLMRAAQLKAEDMAREGYYAHISPDGETPMHWLDQVGYKYQYVGENLTANIRDDERVVSAWMNSPGHRRNLLDSKFTQMGVGVAEGTYKGRDDALFVVQILATPRGSTLPPAPTRPAAVPAKPATPVAVPPAKPIALPKPPVPTPITQNRVVKQVQQLAKPITDTLNASTTARLFTSTTTDTLPLALSSSSVPIELRVATTVEELPPTPGPELRRPDEMQMLGREVSTTWYREVTGFFSGVTREVRSLLKL